MDDGAVLYGYHKKLTTLKNKYFVVYDSRNGKGARVEYYDRRKKYVQGAPPKKSIKIASCLKIDKDFETERENTLSILAESGPFGIVFDAKDNMEVWLEKLVLLHYTEMRSSNYKYPEFRQIWLVNLRYTENATKNGAFYVCLTETSLMFFRVKGEKRKVKKEDEISHFEVFLTSIRRFGQSESAMFLEVGHQCKVGNGIFFLESDTPVISKKMYSVITEALLAGSDPPLQGRFNTFKDPMRKRSCSANEATKPVSVLEKFQVQNKFSKRNTSQYLPVNYGRNRCDSLPAESLTSEMLRKASSIGKWSNNNISSMWSMLSPKTRTKHSENPSESEICSGMDSSSAYRKNRRMSEKNVILEEVDNIGSQFDDTFHVDNDNYALMAPLNVAGNDAAGPSPSLRCSSNLKSVYGMQNVSHFNVNSRYEKPFRTYSIGSAFDHKYRRQSKNDDNISRVRTLSFGSKARVPPNSFQDESFLRKARLPTASNNSSNFVPKINNATNKNEFDIAGQNICNTSTYNKSKMEVHSSTHAIPGAYLEMKPIIDSNFDMSIQKTVKNEILSSPTKFSLPKYCNSDVLLKNKPIACGVNSTATDLNDISINVESESTKSTKSTNPATSTLEENESLIQIGIGRKQNFECEKTKELNNVMDDKLEQHDKPTLEDRGGNQQAEPEKAPQIFGMCTSPLYYAKLDLPQSKSTESKNKDATSSLSMNSQVFSNESSYATIDFEQPDDCATAKLYTL